MPNPIDITGARFGRLTAIRWISSHGKDGRLWQCQCDCGRLSIVPAKMLRAKNTKSCGCQQYNGRLVHGRARTKGKQHYLYCTWQKMRNRCNNPNNENHKHYGGRGIKVCKRWNSFTIFLSDILAAIGERPPGMTLDRIDNDGDYEPGNVKWSTQKEQLANSRVVRNKSNGRFVRHDNVI
jgi:hypothetical protein